MLEDCIKQKYKDHRLPFLNHELIFGITSEEIIKTTNHILKYFNIPRTIEKKLDKYNKSVNEKLEKPKELIRKYKENRTKQQGKITNESDFDDSDSENEEISD
jgi:AAA15 family ATPase/GTPase